MATTMNPEVKAQWTAALRSGDYPQGTRRLRTEDGYCCLGVLCELAHQAGIIPAGVSHGGSYRYGAQDEGHILPREVMTWAGLRAGNPNVDPARLPEGASYDNGVSEVKGPFGGKGAPPEVTLANLNDNGTPFAVVADVIDQQF